MEFVTIILSRGANSSLCKDFSFSFRYKFGASSYLCCSPCSAYLPSNAFLFIFYGGLIPGVTIVRPMLNFGVGTYLTLAVSITTFFTDHVGLEWFEGNTAGPPQTGLLLWKHNGGPGRAGA